MRELEELIKILKENWSPVEIVEYLAVIIRKEYLEKLEEYAVENKVCPECYCELTWYSWKESRGEHFGFPAYEEMSELRCNNCNWS